MQIPVLWISIFLFVILFLGLFGFIFIWGFLLMKAKKANKSGLVPLMIFLLLVSILIMGVTVLVFVIKKG